MIENDLHSYLGDVNQEILFFLKMSRALFSCVSSLLSFCLFSQLLILVSRGYDATEKQRKSFRFPIYWF